MQVTFTGIGRNAGGRSMVVLHRVEVPVYTKEDGIRATEERVALMNTPRILRDRPASLPDTVTCGTCARRLGGKCFLHNETVKDGDGCASYTARKRV